MIIFLYGQDTFRSLEKLKEMKQKFFSEVDPSGLNLLELDGATLTMDDFHGSVSAVSFLARRRMVVVRNVMTKNTSKTLYSDLIEFLDKPHDDDAIIVFWEGKPHGNNPLFKRLKKEKYAQEFSLLTQRQLASWILGRVAFLRATIDSSAVTLLAEYVGNDLFALENEINKLVGYAHGQTITTHHVDIMVHAQFDTLIFHFTDALCSGNARKAYKLLADQLESGAHELYVLTMLSRQFRIMLLLKAYARDTRQNKTPIQIAKELQLHPYVVQKSLLQIQGFTQEALQALYGTLQNMDEDIKTGKASARVLFDLFLAKIFATPSCRLGVFSATPS